jgi:ubiquitin-protein ligase
MLKKSCSDLFQFYQDEENKFIFYFMFQGLKGTDFEGGRYIVKFILAQNYPKSFGRVYILTPNGRLVHSDGYDYGYDKGSLFFTFSDHKNWESFYTLNLVMESLIQMFYDEKVGGISRIENTREEIRRKAMDSTRYNTENHPEIWKKFNQNC